MLFVIPSGRHAQLCIPLDMQSVIQFMISLQYRIGIENCVEAVEQRKQEYIDKLIYWHEHLCDDQGVWADFMMK